MGASFTRGCLSAAFTVARIFAETGTFFGIILFFYLSYVTKKHDHPLRASPTQNSPNSICLASSATSSSYCQSISPSASFPQLACDSNIRTRVSLSGLRWTVLSCDPVRHLASHFARTTRLFRMQTHSQPALFSTAKSYFPHLMDQGSGWSQGG